MARLYLITHAHTQIDPAVDAAHWQLSPTGQAQADALAALPFWADIDRILVSSEVKTHLTIAPVLAQRAIPVTADRRFDEVKRTPLLVLDNLGTESATPWAREKLFQLINFRYTALLPTIITTSTNIKQIEPWLYTRIMDANRCQFLPVIAPSYYGSKVK